MRLGCGGKGHERSVLENQFVIQIFLSSHISSFHRNNVGVRTDSMPQRLCFLQKQLHFPNRYKIMSLLLKTKHYRLHVAKAKKSSRNKIGNIFVFIGFAVVCILYEKFTLLSPKSFIFNIFTDKFYTSWKCFNDSYFVSIQNSRQLYEHSFCITKTYLLSKTSTFL